MTWLTYLKNIADWIRQLSDTVDKLTIAKLYQLLKSLPLFNTVTGYSLNSNQILKGKTAYANNIKVTGTREISNSLVTNTFSYIISTGPLIDTNVCYPAYFGLIVPVRFLDNLQQYQMCGYPLSNGVIFGQYSTAGNIILPNSEGFFLSHPEKYRMVSKYKVEFKHTKKQGLNGQYMYFPIDSRVFVLYNSQTRTLLWNNDVGDFLTSTQGNFEALDFSFEYISGQFNDNFLANKSFTRYSDSDGSVVFSMSLIQQPS